MVGLEFGQDTLRRTLTADPRREALIVSKLVVGLGHGCGSDDRHGF